MFCTSCGKDIGVNPEIKFCPYCGTKIVVSNSGTTSNLWPNNDTLIEAENMFKDYTDVFAFDDIKALELNYASAQNVSRDECKTMEDKILRWVNGKEYIYANQYVDSILERNPGHGYAIFLKGYLYGEAGKYMDALSYYASAIKLGNYDQAFNNSGVIYGNFAQRKKAETFYRQAVALSPDNQTAKNKLNSCRDDAEDISYLFDILCKDSIYPLDINYNFDIDSLKLTYMIDTETLLGKVIKLHNAKQYSEALDVLSSILTETPNHRKAVFWIGRVKDSQGQYIEALRYYATALKINKQNASAYNNIGVIYTEQLKNKQIAAYFYEKAFEKDPNSQAIRKNYNARLPEQSVTCPKCRSTQITTMTQQGFGLGKAITGAALFGPIGLFGGTLGNKKLQLVCMKCGYKWQK